MPHQAKFVQGSILRHIIIMSSTSALGLMALFLVDLLDMYFISLLGHVELAAAIGFAGSLVFFNTSVSIGASIALSAAVSKALGAKKIQDARRYTASAMMFSLLAGCIITTIMLTNADALLELLGAKGLVATKAIAYLNILMPSAPILSMAMAGSAALRATGDAKRSMYATLLGGIVNALFDPLFIFGLDMGIEGAAWASVLARCTIFLYALHGVIIHHKLMEKPSFTNFSVDLKPIFAIAAPAILANVATPFGNAFITRQIAHFGDDFVAGFAVIGRIVPVAFSCIFALSGAIGPIIGQNHGARRLDRVQKSLTDAILFSAFYCILVSVVLWLLKDQIILIFGLNESSSTLVELYCPWIALTFTFNGALFVANASFNNLKRGIWATLLNTGKATIGTIPFVIMGGQMAGAAGVLIGQAVGSALFGVLGYALAYYRVHSIRVSIERQQQEEEIHREPALPMTPFCSSRAYMYEECQLSKEREDNEESSEKDA